MALGYTSSAGESGKYVVLGIKVGEKEEFCPEGFLTQSRSRVHTERAVLMTPQKNYTCQGQAFLPAPLIPLVPHQKLYWQ